MQIGLLGELEVRDDDGAVVVVTGAKLRALLAVLALQVGRPVSADQLVEALWGEDPPTEVRNGLQGLVSKLRRVLGATAYVVNRSGGYVLELPKEAIDVHRFESLVGEARSEAANGNRERSIDLLVEADSLWRGDVLAEFSYEEFAAVTVTRLSELRLAALEERIDAQLALGRHQLVVGDLEAMVAAHPLRERPRCLLMLALYRSGRQADALAVYQDGRRLLGEQLGLDPGVEMQKLEAAILVQDPSLAAPETTGAPSPAASRPVERRSTIPVSLTPLIGRDTELRELIRLFDDHRFVTLVGPGGVGKTRLALEVARARSMQLNNGGCLVELAPVGDPAGVRSAIAKALELPDPNQLARMIGDRELILVLDNCEHVITTAAGVAEDLLQRCPGLRLLATSREGLRVGGESVWPVPPLAPDAAAQLFIERSQAVGAQLELSTEVLAAISQICVRLDGLPLAIELAAARTRAFPLHQILSRLNDRFRLLTGGSRTALPRQQTLRAVVDWSYELLFVDEQRVFERLSVFPGGCDLATAIAVCADSDLPGEDLEDIIHALIDKSLVIAAPRTEDLRVLQLQTLAQYGRERLAERGESERIRNAMAAHYAHLCAASAAAFSGDEQRTWLRSIDTEQDNLRGALEWAVANNDAETALAIAGGASWPHWLRGTMVEGKRWLDEAFSCRGDVSDSTRAMALAGRALMDLQLGAPEHVDEDLETALALFRAQNDVAAIALVYSFYAEVAVVRGDRAEARKRRLDVLAFHSAFPDVPFSIAARAYSQAKLAMLDGDHPAAEHFYREASDGFSRIDRPIMQTMCLGMVADFDERKGEYRAAARELASAVRINDEFGLKGFNGALLARLGWALLQDGDTASAELEFRRSLDLGRRLNNTPVIFFALTGLAAVHRLAGRDDEAVVAGAEALRMHQAGSPRRLSNRVDPLADELVGAAACCTVLACVAADRGNGLRAAELLGHAERLRGESINDVPTFQRDDLRNARERAVAMLGSDAFLDAFERARVGRLGDAVLDV